MRATLLLTLLGGGGAAFAPGHLLRSRVQQSRVAPAPQMGLSLDLTGKVAFVAGVGDSTGYGWAICKALPEAGATVTVGTWPPVLKIFKSSLKSGRFDEDAVLSDGSIMKIAGIYPLDAVFDAPEDVPEDVKTNKRHAGRHDAASISDAHVHAAAPRPSS